MRSAVLAPPPPTERAALDAADRLSETIGFFYFKTPPRAVTSKPVGNAESGSACEHLLHDCGK